MPKALNYRVLVEQDEDGIFVAQVPSLQGCYTEGDTYESVMLNIKDAIKLHLEARKGISELSDDTYTEFIGIKSVSIPYGSFANPQTI